MTSILLKRSATANSVPATSALQSGEVALNTNDGRMFFKKTVASVDSLIEVTTNQNLASTAVLSGADLVGRATVAVASVQDLQTIKQDSTQTILLAAYYPGVYALSNPGRADGNGALHWAPNMPRSNHNGGTIFSPTVPWDGTQGTLAAYLAGTGETASGSNGCFIRSFDRLLVTYFGAKNDDAGGSGTDSYAAIQATLNYAVSAVIGEVYVLGSFMITNTLVMNTGVYTQSLSLVGGGSTSNIRQTGSGKDLLWFSTTQFMRNSYIKNINLSCTSSAGHGINIKYGCTVCRFENVNITVNSTTKSCYKGDWSGVALGSPAGVFDTVWDGGDLYVPTGSTVFGIDFICNGTVFNENVFRNQRWNQATTVQFARFVNNDTSTYLVNNRFSGINFEVCKGGGILAYNAKNWLLENLSFWDVGGAYTGHLIRFASNSGLVSSANKLANITRNGDSLSGGANDIFLEYAQDTVVENCLTPSANSPSYDWNHNRVTVIGATLSGELNYENRVYASPSNLVTAFGTITGSSGATTSAMNILSVSRSSAGIYVVTFIAAKAATTYRVHCSLSHGTLGWVDTTKSTGSFTIYCTNSSGAAFDPGTIDFTVFG